MKKLLLAAFVLAACSGDKKSDSKSGDKKSDGGKVASCKLETMCEEYRGANLAMGTENLEKLCVIPEIGGTFSETACPTEGAVGICKIDTKTSFFYAPFTADEAKSMCSSGTFTAP